MVEIGKFNTLQVIKHVNFGIYLDGEDLGNILLPSRYLPNPCELHSWLDVFVYVDSNDMLIATTDTPKVEVGHCELLRVADINNTGAFMDWGLPKELLVPYNEQQKPMQVGFSYVVYVFHDKTTDRIAASSKLSHHLQEETTELKPRQAVALQIANRTEIGYKTVINNQYLGLIFREDAFRPLKIGERLPGFVKAVRADGKIDLIISQSNVQVNNELGERILEHLAAAGGESNLTDKSDPEAIYRTFKVSKKKYKQALGTLYKHQHIVITAEKISLVK